jgi:hypothetical protein
MRTTLPAHARRAHHAVRGRRGGRAELVLFAGVYLVYAGARWLWAGHLDTAIDNAHGVLRLEAVLGMGIEAPVQSAIGSGAGAWIFSDVYLLAQLIVLPGSLFALFRWAPDAYRHLRNTIAATALLAVPVFALLPVAPPRLARIGIADTVSAQAISLGGPSTYFYNPYAAVPSLHVGFAFAIGAAVAMAVRPGWLKAVVLLWGPLVTVAVVATGNHYVFDAVTGLALAVLGALAGHAVAAMPRPGRALARSAAAGARPVARRGLAVARVVADAALPGPARAWLRRAAVAARPHVVAALARLHMRVAVPAGSDRTR